MSEQQENFIKELSKKYDDKYTRMQNFFIAVLVVILGAFLTIGSVQIASGSATKKQTEINTQNIKFIMENSASIKAIDRLIMTFETQTQVMEQYLPSDVQGAIKEFNKKSSELRGNIMVLNSNLQTRSVEINETGN
jgi:hypothetical protein